MAAYSGKLVLDRNAILIRLQGKAYSYVHTKTLIIYYIQSVNAVWKVGIHKIDYWRELDRDLNIKRVSSFYYFVLNSFEDGVFFEGFANFSCLCNADQFTFDHTVKKSTVALSLKYEVV